MNFNGTGDYISIPKFSDYKFWFVCKSADKWNNGFMKINQRTGLSTNPGCMVKLTDKKLIEQMKVVFKDWI